MIADDVYSLARVDCETLRVAVDVLDRVALDRNVFRRLRSRRGVTDNDRGPRPRRVHYEVSNHDDVTAVDPLDCITINLDRTII